MDLAEYFKQTEMYFSESSGQLVRIDEMPFQRAFYSHYKLLREFDSEYEGSELYQKFISVLDPKPAVIREQLQKFGKATHRYLNSTTEVRSKLYSAARVAGRHVTTHKHEHQKGLGWVEATVDTEVNVTVTSHRSG